MTDMPPSVSYGRVTGRFLRTDDDATATPAAGRVVWTSGARRLIDSTGRVIVIPTPPPCVLDSDGRLVDATGAEGVSLVATDDADLSPSGWTWTCRVELVGARAYSTSFSLPAGSTVDLTEVTPVPVSSGEAVARGPAGPGVAAGGSDGQALVKASDQDYDTAWSDLPSAAVSSVNGKTGAVVLDADDVGADATGAASSALTEAQSYTDTAVANKVDNTDPRLSDARTPTAHAASHGSGGDDPVTVAQSQVGGLEAALAGKLDVGAIWTGTEADYDALTPTAGVLYFTVDS